MGPALAWLRVAMLELTRGTSHERRLGDLVVRGVRSVRNPDRPKDGLVSGGMGVDPEEVGSCPRSAGRS